jgi:hypothetical protein
MATVYKIVRQLNGKFCSAWMNGECRTTYEIGKATKSKFGPLFAFNTLENARYWKMSMFRESENVSIVEATARLSRIQPKHLEDTQGLLSEKESRRFWREAKANKGCHLARVPRGTVFCSSIQPLEIV